MKDYREYVNVRNLRDYAHYTDLRFKAFKCKMHGEEYITEENDVIANIVKNQRFTNIARELDRETIWLIDNVINTNISSLNKALNIVLFRTINTGESFKAIDKYFPIDFSKITDEKLLEISEYENRESNKKFPKIKTAYFLSHIGKIYNTTIAREDLKLNFRASRIAYVNKFKDLVKQSIEHNSSVECVNTLMKIPGIGDFLGYQVWVDFTYDKELGKKFNENDLVISGPGCSKGISYFLFNEVVNLKEKGVDPNEFMIWFEENINSVMKENGVKWDIEEKLSELKKSYNGYLIPNWTLMKIENSFCEFNKLFKYINNLPMKKRTYRHNQLT